MSKVAKIVSAIASVVAIASQIAFFVTGNPIFGVIAAVASAVAAVSGAVAQATARRPDARGSVNQVIIGRNMPVPYGMGRTYSGGMQVYDKSAGEKNKDRTQIMVVSAAGPIESFQDILADYTAIGFVSGGIATGYYADYLWAATRTGTRPETAFSAPAGRAAFTDWDSTYKLSGYAAYCVTMKFDKEGERYASGVPQWGAVYKAVKVYDPRLDSSYPGGSGSHDWDDESTFTFGSGSNPEGENPALHALTYARGRFIEKDAGGTPLANPVKIVGCGFEFDQIEVAQFVELANVCDANGWKIGGTIYEGPGISKWDNLKRILQAAAAEPVWSGGKLGLKISAPRTSVVTIGLPDLADGELSVQAMKSWRDKVNTVVPRVRLEEQKWEYVQLEEVSVSSYVTEDGETKSTEVQFDLVQAKDQGAELAAYHLVNGREFGPIQLPLKPYFMIYKVGEAATITLDELGLDAQLAIITGRTVDPATGTVILTLESETTAKHSFALGQTGVAPPTPTIVPPEDLDSVTSDLQMTAAAVTSLIATSSASNLTGSITTAGAVTVSTHDRIYADKTVSVTGATVSAPSGAASGDTVVVFYDDPARAGGAVTYQNALMVAGAGQFDAYYPSASNPYRHFVIALPVPASGTGSGGSGQGPGTGGAGGGGAGGGGGWDTNYS